MKYKFKLEFPEGMPKGTAQQKRYNSQRKMYFKDKKLIHLETAYFKALYPNRIKEPLTGPTKMTIWFGFDIKEKRRWGTYKTSTPDLDNYAKALIDVMSKETIGFFSNDSIIADLRLIKTYSEKAFIWIEIEELDKNFGGVI